MKSAGDTVALRIGIDGRLLGDNLTGIGRYTVELCRELAHLLPAAQFFVYAPWDVRMPVHSPRWTARVDPLQSLFRRLRDRWYTKHLWMLLREAWLCREDRLDIFWATQAPFIPTLPRSIRVVAILYDLQYRVVPNTLRPAARIGHRLLERRLRRADAIVTISAGTAERLQRILGYPTAAVVSPAVSNEFRPCNEQEINRCLATLGIRRPYLLSVASWDPRKNLEVLINAFVAMKDDGLLHGYSLALVGAKRGHIDGRLDALVAHSVGRDVRVVGFVPDDCLPALYTGASAFIFPSLYEGFGMPVLEARACGTRVVASDLQEIREAGDDEVIYIPPIEAAIRSGIIAALARPCPPPLKGRRLTWEESAQSLIRVFRNI